MMFESSSPFDEALAKPFLGEPAKKKWSLLSSSTASTMLSQYYDGDDDDSESSGEYEAPEEVVVFDNGKDGPKKLVLDEAELQPMDLEEAIVRERHSAIGEVHQSMSQILDIQNGKQVLSPRSLGRRA